MAKRDTNSPNSYSLLHKSVAELLIPTDQPEKKCLLKQKKTEQNNLGKASLLLQAPNFGWHATP